MTSEILTRLEFYMKDSARNEIHSKLPRCTPDTFWRCYKTLTSEVHCNFLLTLTALDCCNANPGEHHG